MNSKERVKAAIERKAVDKMPLGFYVVDHDTIAKVIGRPTYVRNKPAQQIAFWEGRRDEVIESMKEDITDFYKKIDCVDLLTFKEVYPIPPRGYKPEDPPRKVDDTTYEDEKGNVYKVSFKSNSIALVHDAERPKELPTYSEEMFADRTLPDEPDSTCFELLDHLIETFGQDRYIATLSAGTTAVTLLGGMERGFMTMALQPEVIKACNRQKVFRQNYLDQFYIRAGADGVLMEQDFAGTKGPFISPDMFRELAFPFLRQRIENVKKYLSRVILHCCGNTLLLMDMLLEAGIDAYESIQTGAEISIDILAERYGNRLCIWGAIPLEVLISGTPEDTRKAVRENIESGKKAPGFILGPSHSIAFGTKYDNFMAMLDEFNKLR